MPEPTPDPDRDFAAARRITRHLQPFWDALSRRQAEHSWITDAHLLAALGDVPGSALLRILQADGRDLDAFRAATNDLVEAARVHGLVGGLTDPARRVIQAMHEEVDARQDVQREEYLLLALLRAATPEVRALLAEYGLDRARILRQLPAELRAAALEASATPSPAAADPALLPALAHSSAIRLMDFVYEGKRQGRPPSPLRILIELAQLPGSAAARIAAEQSHAAEHTRTILRDASLAESTAASARPADRTLEADRIMSTALGLWRGRGELTLDHFLLALLETTDPAARDTLARLGITPDRIRATLPRLGAEM
ncbi:MAG: Clp protease N-terminal domain-containing protein [Dehalococcoidia bacterium]|nr:Clp protease N-terminal domain-containing protein [Dehalococcoidia bacterium]